jgi:hypothetical protein
MGRSSPAAPGGGAAAAAASPTDQTQDDPASSSFAAGGGWLGAGAVRFAAKAESKSKSAAAAAAAAAAPSTSSSSRPGHRGHHLSDADLDEPVPRELTDLAAPHVESFDAFLERGLDLVVQRLPEVEVRGRVEEREREEREKREEVGERFQFLNLLLFKKQKTKLNPSLRTRPRALRTATGSRTPTSACPFARTGAAEEVWRWEEQREEEQEDRG